MAAQSCRAHGCSSAHSLHTLALPSDARSPRSKAALDRVGIEGAHRGAHIFRHSLATELLRSSATLSEIGQLLRHERTTTPPGYQCAQNIEPALAGRREMTNLRCALDKYLSMRMGLGYKYEHQPIDLPTSSPSWRRRAGIITTKLAMEWATLPPDRHAS